MIAVLLFAVAPPVAEPLPPGAVERLGSLRWRPPAYSGVIRFLPDGSGVVVTSSAGGPAVIELAGGTVRRLTDGPVVTYSLTLGPGGRTLLTGSPDGLRLWDAKTGRVLRRFGEGVHAVLGHDGRWAASAVDNKGIIVYDVATGKELRSFKPTHRHYWPVAHPSRDEVALIDYEGVLEVYDAGTGRLRWRAVTHTPPLGRGRGYNLAYTPGGDLVSGGNDGTVQLWRADGTPGRVLARGGKACVGVAAASGRVAAAFDDGTVRVYEGGKEARRWATPAGYHVSLAFSPDGATLASLSSQSGVLALWDAATGRRLNPTDGHASQVAHLLYLKDGRLVSVDGSGAAMSWTGRAGTPIPPLRGWSPDVTADGRRTAVGQNDGSVLVREGGRERRLPGPRDQALGVRFSPDGRRLAVHYGNNEGLGLWDVAAGKLLHTVPLSDRYLGPSDGPKWTADGRIVVTAQGDGSGGRETLIRAIDAERGVVLRTLTAPRDATSIAVAPHGTLVAVGAPGKILLWDAATGEIVRSWDHGQRYAGDVRFSPCGRMLATNSRSDVGGFRVWEAATGRLLVRRDGTRYDGRPLAFSPDGRVVAAGAGDTTVLLWDVTGRLKGGRLTPASGDAEARWRRLGSDDAAVAHAAVWELASTTAESAALLARRLGPALPIEPGRLADVLGRLGSDEFAARQAAEDELRRHGPGAGPALRKALPALPLEARRRVERLLKAWRESPEALRDDRAVMALGQMGDAGVPLLRRLAAGAPGAALTDAARRELKRDAR